MLVFSSTGFFNISTHSPTLHPNSQTMSYLHLSSTRNLRSSQAKDHKLGSTCNPARLYGVFLGQALPHFLCSSPSLKYRADSIWCTFPELICRCEKPPCLQQKEEVKDLTGLLEDVHPCDTTLWPPLNQSENCAQTHHRSYDPNPLNWLLKVLCGNAGGARALLGQEAPSHLAEPCNKPFSAPNSIVSVCLALSCAGHRNLS